MPQTGQMRVEPGLLAIFFSGLSNFSDRMSVYCPAVCVSPLIHIEPLKSTPLPGICRSSTSIGSVSSATRSLLPQSTRPSARTPPPRLGRRGLRLGDHHARLLLGSFVWHRSPRDDHGAPYTGIKRATTPTNRPTGSAVPYHLDDSFAKPPVSAYHSFDRPFVHRRI